MLGVPSLPGSLATRLCCGESADGRFRDGILCDSGCDCAEEEEDHRVCGGATDFPLAACPEVGRLSVCFVAILTVAPGSSCSGGVLGLASENGRNSGVSSSSASESGFKLDLAEA